MYSSGSVWLYPIQTITILVRMLRTSLCSTGSIHKPGCLTFCILFFRRTVLQATRKSFGREFSVDQVRVGQSIDYSRTMGPGASRTASFPLVYTGSLSVPTQSPFTVSDGLQMISLCKAAYLTRKYNDDGHSKSREADTTSSQHTTTAGC